MAIKNRLREMMTKTRTTQSELAEIVGTGRSNISSILAGKSLPSLEVAIRMADYFGVMIEDIFFEEHKEDRELFLEVLEYLEDILTLELKGIISEETSDVMKSEIIDRNIPENKIEAFYDFRSNREKKPIYETLNEITERELERRKQKK